jgi:transposase InsO family protein
MEAVPLSAISAADCSRASVFQIITRFGVPDMITFNCVPQFTSNLWAEQCDMLNISCRQTTAYDPEANGALERLHRRLKDALHARAAAATWAEEIPWVLLVLCS